MDRGKAVSGARLNHGQSPVPICPWLFNSERAFLFAVHASLEPRNFDLPAIGQMNAEVQKSNRPPAQASNLAQRVTSHDRLQCSFSDKLVIGYDQQSKKITASNFIIPSLMFLDVTNKMSAV